MDRLFKDQELLFHQHFQDLRVFMHVPVAMNNSIAVFLLSSQMAALFLLRVYSDRNRRHKNSRFGQMRFDERCAGGVTKVRGSNWIVMKCLNRLKG